MSATRPPTLMHPATHRQLYPEQYTHPLVGRQVDVKNLEGQPFRRGTVTRVVNTRFGPLAVLNEEVERAYSVSDCYPVAESPPEVGRFDKVQIHARAAEAVDQFFTDLVGTYDIPSGDIAPDLADRLEMLKGELGEIATAWMLGNQPADTPQG